MPLDEYNKKRNFGKTSEPKGEEKSSQHGNIFVIQKHQARNLHYDLRIELDGVLKSWAVPKEPPQKEGIKRLAVQTEDHPMDYAGFEGEIVKGEYGAGTALRPCGATTHRSPRRCARRPRAAGARS
ncbi:MAG: hypothetical protein KKB85_01225 [Candidatus Altiarchaeota archaeon]|nr:hypothetical protein [Candidatus Altiarchaeota archaeon]